MSTVEDKDTVAMAVDKPTAEELTEKSKQNSITVQDISKNIALIVKGIELNQPRILLRALRQNASIRKYATGLQIEEIIKKHIPMDAPVYVSMITMVAKIPIESVSSTEEKDESDAMDVDESKTMKDGPVIAVLPEVEVYIYTLIVTTLLRYELNGDAAFASTNLIDRVKSFNRRSLDIFSAKAYFYLSLSYEKINKLENIRSTLMSLYRTACVRHDEMGQAVLLNLLLRNYLHSNLFEQAHTLSLRATFPENASNNQFCRYLYYIGRIQATQLEYSEAYQRLMMAARKAPQGYASGFTVMVNKLIVIVQLLMGDIPERSLFNQEELRVALAPYLALTSAVRNGDLIQFGEVVEKHKAAFKADKNFTLVERLGHNVLKTGLRKISVSYSRIALADIAKKLHLQSPAAAEYICAKAIKDGVIEAKIDHENGWLSSHEVLDLYSTEEPQKAFHRRIAFCLDVHNDAVKSMRYPPDETYKKNKKTDDTDKSEEKTIEELIKEYEEDMEE